MAYLNLKKKSDTIGLFQDHKHFILHIGAYENLYMYLYWRAKVMVLKLDLNFQAVANTILS